MHPRSMPLHPRWCAATRVLAACLLAAAAAPAAATLTPTGAIQRVDDASPGCGLVEPDVEPAGDGFVAVWGEPAGVRLRQLTATGAPLGAEVEVTGGTALHPVVEPLGDGSSLVVWYDHDSRSVRARRMAAGVAEPAATLGSVGGYPGPELNGLDVASTAAGTVIVAWADGPALKLRALDATGAPIGTDAFELVSYPGVLGVHPVPYDPVLLPRADGSVRVQWILAGTYFGQSGEQGSVDGFLVRHQANGFAVLEALNTGLVGRDLAGAALADGSSVLVAARSYPPSYFPPSLDTLHEVWAQRFDAPTGATPPIELLPASAQWADVRELAVAAVPGGGFVAAWQALAADEADPQVFVREVAADGAPTGPAISVDGGAGPGSFDPALAALPGGPVTALWRDSADHFTPPCPGGSAVLSRPLALGCGAPGAFCADGGRFRVELTYSDPRRGLSGLGRGVALTGDSGYFWFFAPDNVEVVVKVLDGRAVNGHYWVFYGGLTDLGFTLTVTDTATGAVRTFEQAPGTLASRGVTDAFPAAGTAAGGAQVRVLRVTGLVRDAFPGDRRTSRLGPVENREAPAVAATDDPAILGVPPCTPPQLPVVPGPGLCLNGRRFSVVARWRDFAGHTGVGHGVHLGDDSGYLWFFHPDNVELVVKVLDGRPVNGHFWVFYGALSNVEYDLQVEHVLGNDYGADGEAAYHNPSATFASHADTEALRPPQDVACPAVVDPVCGTDGITYASACDAEAYGWVTVAHLGPCP